MHDQPCPKCEVWGHRVLEDGTVIVFVACGGSAPEALLVPGLGPAQNRNPTDVANSVG